MSQGGQVAMRADEDVVAASRARELEQRVRELERLPGRKTLEVEVLKEALAATSKKSPSGSCRRHHAAVPGEGHRRDLGRCQIQSGRAAQGAHHATSSLSAARRRGPVVSHSQAHRRPSDLWVSADYRTAQPGPPGVRRRTGQSQAGLPVDGLRASFAASPCRVPPGART